MNLRTRILRVLTSLNTFLFSVAMFGNIKQGECASSAAWNLYLQGRWQGKLMVPIIDAIFFWDKHHCKASWEWQRQEYSVPFYTMPASSIPTSMQVEKLAASIDFRPNTETVDDQKRLGSCVAHAGQTAIEITYERAGRRVDLSRMYLYYFVQQTGGTLGTDGGGYTSMLGRIVNSAGVCLETTWPYDENQLGQMPSVAASTEARNLFPAGCADYSSVGGLVGIKRALNRGQPCPLTMFVHDDFMALGKDWRLHSWDVSTNPVGLHAVCVIGYDDAAKRLLCENSWGSGWGDGGFFGIPYDYFQRGVIVDAYSFTRLPVPAIPVQAFQEAGIAEFKDGILEIPYLFFTPGGLSGAVYAKAVVLRIKAPGAISFGSDAFSKTLKTDYLNMSTIIGGERHLGLHKVRVGDAVYEKVLLIGPDLELISWSQE